MYTLFLSWRAGQNGVVSVTFTGMVDLKNHCHPQCEEKVKTKNAGGCEIAQEITGREPILSKICITANVQENVILHYKTFYFVKTCAET
jgi:hypothetical protein